MTIGLILSPYDSTDSYYTIIMIVKVVAITFVKTLEKSYFNYDFLLQIYLSWNLLSEGPLVSPQKLRYQPR